MKARSSLTSAALLPPSLPPTPPQVDIGVVKKGGNGAEVRQALEAAASDEEAWKVR